jgi:hypothetical protein
MAYESAMPFTDARVARSMEEWLRELDGWEAGRPPPPPSEWGKL